MKKKTHNRFLTGLKTATAQVRNLVIGSHYGVSDPFYFDLFTKQQIDPTMLFKKNLAKYKFKWSVVLVLYWDTQNGPEAEIYDINVDKECFYRDLTSKIKEYQDSIEEEEIGNKFITGNAILITPVIQVIPETFVNQMIDIMESVDEHIKKRQEEDSQ